MAQQEHQQCQPHSICARIWALGGGGDVPTLAFKALCAGWHLTVRVPFQFELIPGLQHHRKEFDGVGFVSLPIDSERPRRATTARPLVDGANHSVWEVCIVPVVLEEEFVH